MLPDLTLKDLQKMTAEFSGWLKHLTLRLLALVAPNVKRRIKIVLACVVDIIPVGGAATATYAIKLAKRCLRIAVWTICRIVLTAMPCLNPPQISITVALADRKA